MNPVFCALALVAAAAPAALAEESPAENLRTRLQKLLDSVEYAAPIDVAALSNLERDAEKLTDADERQRLTDQLRVWKQIAAYPNATRFTSSSETVSALCKYFRGDEQKRIVAGTSMKSRDVCMMLLETRLPAWGNQVKYAAAAVAASQGDNTLGILIAAATQDTANKTETENYDRFTADCAARLSVSELSIPNWAKAAESDDARIRRLAAEMLIDIDYRPAARAALRKRLSDPDENLRERVVLRLACLLDEASAPGAREIIEKESKHQTPGVVKMAELCSYLHQMHQKEVPWEKVEALFDSPPKSPAEYWRSELRVTAELCLKAGRTEKALEYLNRVMAEGITEIEQGGDNRSPTIVYALEAAVLLANMGRGEGMETFALWASADWCNYSAVVPIIDALAVFMETGTRNADFEKNRQRAYKIGATIYARLESYGQYWRNALEGLGRARMLVRAELRDGTLLLTDIIPADYGAKIGEEVMVGFGTQRREVAISRELFEARFRSAELGRVDKRTMESAFNKWETPKLEAALWSSDKEVAFAAWKILWTLGRTYRWPPQPAPRE